MTNVTLWSKIVFEKDVNSHSNNKRLKPDLRAHKFVQQWCFFPLLSCNFDDQLTPSFHEFVILNIVGIHQVRILVFDNYQKCPIANPQSVMLTSSTNSLSNINHYFFQYLERKKKKSVFAFKLKKAYHQWSNKTNDLIGVKIKEIKGKHTSP